MNRFKQIITVFAFSLLVAGLPTLASAQWRDRDNNDDDYSRNGSYNDNRRLEQIIDNLKNSAKQFNKDVDRSRNVDRNLENAVEKFWKASDRLEDRFDRKKMNKTYNEAQNLVYAAEQLDREFQNGSRYGNRNGGYNDDSRYFQQQWNNLRRNVQTIADAYNIRYNNRGGWGRGNGNGNGRGNNNGNWRDKFPFPLPF